MQLPAAQVFALLLQTGASVRNRYRDGVPQKGRLPRLTVALIRGFCGVAGGSIDMHGLDVFAGITRVGRGCTVVYLPRSRRAQKNTAAAVPRQMELFALDA